MSTDGRARGWRWLAVPAAFAVLALLGVGARLRDNAPAPRRHVVEISGLAFHPAVLEVAPGDTVVWINRDIFPHTATAADSAGWSTGILIQGQSGVFVPSRRGEAPYFCQLHPIMRGRLNVR